MTTYIRKSTLWPFISKGFGIYFEIIDTSSKLTSEILSMIYIPLPLDELVGLTIHKFLSLLLDDDVAIY